MLYVPDGLPAQAPLVVMLHGGFGSAAQAERAYGWDRLADTAKFAVAYPDGLGRAWNAGGGCCGRSAADGVDDVGFVAAAVSDIARQVDVDPKRVYATGISNGGMMTYALACRTALFAAIARTPRRSWIPARPRARRRCCTSTALRTPGSVTTADGVRASRISTGRRCRR